MSTLITTPMDIQQSFIEQITTEDGGIAGIHMEVANKLCALRFACNPKAQVSELWLGDGNVELTILSPPIMATTSCNVVTAPNERVFQEELALAFAEQNASPSDFQIHIIPSAGIDRQE